MIPSLPPPNKTTNVNTRFKRWTELGWEQRYNLRNLGIQPSDWTILLGSNMLNNFHMNAANKLLKKQFPLIEGLFPPELGVTRDYPSKITGIGCTIHHVVSSPHYILSTHKYGDIRLYDSLDEHNSVEVQNQIAMVYGRIGQYGIFYTFDECQQQIGSFSCGFFSIARAYAFCCGLDPSKIFFDEFKMKDHFCGCLLKGVITSFPEIPTKSNNERISKIKCGHILSLLPCCWLPSNFWKEPVVTCTSCNQLTHKICFSTNFICDKCKEKKKGVYSKGTYSIAEECKEQ